MKIVDNSPKTKPPVTIEFTPEEADLLYELSGLPNTISDLMAKDGYWGGAKHRAGKLLLNGLRSLFLDQK